MKPVSYSGLQMYTRCPSAFNRKYVLGEKGVAPDKGASPAMSRGSEIHRGIEKFCLHDGAFPTEVDFYEPFFTELRKLPDLVPEVRWAFAKDWTPVDWGSADASIRGIVDSMLLVDNTIHVYEYKTGRMYPDHMDQLYLYSFAAMLAYPGVDNCEAHIVYLDQKQNTSKQTSRAQVAGLEWLWTKRVAEVQPPQDYPTKPSWRCKMCAFRHDCADART